MKYTHKTIEELMLQFSNVTGKDHDRYRNHVYRVFLNCLLQDDDKSNEEKYAVAAVFHDIGIWTNNTIDYLKPSIEQACIYLSKTGRDSWAEEITLMIFWHHKMRKYQGRYGKTVENFRRADWIDVSLGLLSFGCDKKAIKNNKKVFPNLGFHAFLIKKVMANFSRHPFNPLPMFKN